MGLVWGLDPRGRACATHQGELAGQGPGGDGVAGRRAALRGLQTAGVGRQEKGGACKTVCGTFRAGQEGLTSDGLPVAVRGEWLIKGR